MKYRFLKITSPFLLSVFVLCAAPVSESALPNETLHYIVNWPTGVSLGEAQLTASTSAEGTGSPHMHFQFDLNASVPGFAIDDKFSSGADESFCSARFQKTIAQGSKRSDDTETFDPKSGTVTRGSGLGQSETNTGTCGKDALTFLYFLRRELSQGRIPPPQTVSFGAPYEIQLDSAGNENIKIGSATVETNHLKATVTGPSSSITFDLFFLQDRARTLALVRVPLALGTFSMELAK
ncbi:MAG: DUF3108 domain-containing protein [Bryobacterales bacterium]|nr:DUF3108 domain-containing protein [Bryobacterales bacterium]